MLFIDFSFTCLRRRRYDMPVLSRRRYAADAAAALYAIFVTLSHIYARVHDYEARALSATRLLSRAIFRRRRRLRFFLLPEATIFHVHARRACCRRGSAAEARMPMRERGREAMLRC